MGKNKEKIILGIDPGTNIFGFGILQQNNLEIKNIYNGVLQLKAYNDHAVKLKKIYEEVHILIEKFNPDELAIEAPFFGINVQSMLKLGRVQGVVMAAALSKQISITEYAPKKVKIAVTGNGNASKEQVSEMVKRLLNLKETTFFYDSTDALAVAICHSLQKNTKSNKNASWKEFLKDNPSRIF